jgi:hypothetical protein
MTPVPTFESQSLLVFILGLFGLLGAAASATSVLKNIALWKATKKPSSEEANLREFATKADLAAFRCEWQAVCKVNHDRTEKTFADIFNILRSQNEKLIERLDQFNANLNDWQRGIERQMGKIEGSIDHES